MIDIETYINALRLNWMIKLLDDAYSVISRKKKFHKIFFPWQM